MVKRKECPFVFSLTSIIELCHEECFGGQVKLLYIMNLLH
jgi:hypothetical protein